jgi:DNA-binding transcriptional MerR regulator
MRISELSRRTGVPARMLRYYEEQRLVTPRRLANGYREYDDYLVERVQKIRGLMDSGIPTRIIGDILPCLGHPDNIIVAEPDPELRALLVEQRDKMAERIAVLSQNLEALTRYIEEMGQTEPVQHA